MAERSVTVDGTSYPLPELFVVVATQNPQDMEGTFPLPEAQRDRFMTRISVGYPDEASEIAMVTGRSDPGDPASGEVPGDGPAVTVDDVVRAQDTVNRVTVTDEVARYLVRIVAATRTHPGITLGASPRAALHLTQMARSRAAVAGRSYVIPDDIATLAATVLPHRLELQGRHATVEDFHAAAAGIVSDIVSSTGLR